MSISVRTYQYSSPQNSESNSECIILTLHIFLDYTPWCLSFWVYWLCSNVSPLCPSMGSSKELKCNSKWKHTNCKRIKIILRSLTHNQELIHTTVKSPQWEIPMYPYSPNSRSPHFLILAVYLTVFQYIKQWPRCFLRQIVF